MAKNENNSKELESKKAEKLKIESEKVVSNIDKSTYIVCVTGFLALGTMFRAGKKISGETYKNHVSQWLKDGKIQKVGK